MSQLKLVTGVKEGNTERVFDLVKKGFPVDEEDELGLTPLIWAAHAGNKEIVKILLEHGAKIDRQSRNGSTAIHQAAFQGHHEVVRFLLQKGADPFVETDETTDPPNVTPLEWSIYSTLSNQQTRSLLREAVQHLDEQERRVFKKFLEQNNLLEYEGLFIDHGIKTSNLKKVTDIDLRKMNITIESERERILRIFRGKKPVIYMQNSFGENPSATQLNQLSNIQPKKKKSVLFSVDFANEPLRLEISKALSLTEYVMSGAAITPAIGMFRVREHVNNAIPTLVSTKKSLISHLTPITGATTDIEYSTEDTKKIGTITTFQNIKQLLDLSIHYAGKIRLRLMEEKAAAVTRKSTGSSDTRKFSIQAESGSVSSND